MCFTSTCFWIENGTTNDSGPNGNRHPPNLICSQFLCAHSFYWLVSFQNISNLTHLCRIYLLNLCPGFVLLSPGYMIRYLAFSVFPSKPLRSEASVSQSISTPPDLFESSHWQILKQNWEPVALNHPFFRPIFNRKCVRQIDTSVCGLYWRFHLDIILLAKLVSCVYQTQWQYYTKPPSQPNHIFLEVSKQLPHCPTAFSFF
jgi:hypothetical protein